LCTENKDGEYRPIEYWLEGDKQTTKKPDQTKRKSQYAESE